MNAHRLEALATFAGKLTQLDEKIRECVQSQNEIGRHFATFSQSLRRLQGAATDGVSTKDKAEAIYEALKPCPGAYTKLAANAQELSRLTAELQTIVFETFLRNA